MDRRIHPNVILGRRLSSRPRQNRLSVLCLWFMCLSGCTAAPLPVLDAVPRTETIWLIARGWHTDIAMPAARVSGATGRLRMVFPDVVTLTIGFGDRAYLTHPLTGSGDMIAALAPGPGALLVTALRGAPEASFPAGDVVRLSVSAPGMSRLNDFVAHSLGGRPRLLAQGPYPGSLFYASDDTYSAFHTCNTWTAEALREAGLPVRAAGVLFQSGIMSQARRIAAVTGRAGPDH